MNHGVSVFQTFDDRFLIIRTDSAKKCRVNIVADGKLVRSREAFVQADEQRERWFWDQVDQVVVPLDGDGNYIRGGEQTETN
jgi:hypothetical protein